MRRLRVVARWDFKRRKAILIPSRSTFTTTGFLASLSSFPSLATLLVVGFLIVRFLVVSPSYPASFLSASLSLSLSFFLPTSSLRGPSGGSVSFASVTR